MKWNEVLKTYPEANFLQSPEYAQMNEILGDKTLLLELGDKGYGLAIVRDAKRGKYLEIPCGPLIDWEDEQAANEMLTVIREAGRCERCVFVRIRPQIKATSENLALLARLGLKKSPMHLAAEHTVMIDLLADEPTMLARMRRQTRYEVRRAEKLRIVVSKGQSRTDFEEFYRVQQETAKRQGFVPPSLKVLLAEREAFLENIWIYKATLEDEPVAYGLIIGCGKEADYYEAASTELNRKIPGAYALLWQAMRDLKGAGYERFNLWGIAPAGQPNHRYAGVTTFKTGFGGEVVEYVPAHDLVLSKVGYIKDYIVEMARKKRRNL